MRRISRRIQAKRCHFFSHSAFLFRVVIFPRHPERSLRSRRIPRSDSPSFPFQFSLAPQTSAQYDPGKLYSKKQTRGPPLLGGPLLATRAWCFVRSAGALVLYGQDVDCAGEPRPITWALAAFAWAPAILRAIVLGQMPDHFANIRDPGCAQRMPLREQAARYVTGTCRRGWMLAAAFVDELAGFSVAANPRFS